MANFSTINQTDATQHILSYIRTLKTRVQRERPCSQPISCPPMVIGQLAFTREQPLVYTVLLLNKLKSADGEIKVHEVSKLTKSNFGR